ncbi:hypothetical protein XI08_10885 [Bradyrhizobium sp. CCBAU 11361]|nr:hypothetical protein [Bradyrhizobium sp. CCBAU 11361]
MSEITIAVRPAFVVLNAILILPEFRDVARTDRDFSITTWHIQNIKWLTDSGNAPAHCADYLLSVGNRYPEMISTLSHIQMVEIVWFYAIADQSAHQSAENFGAIIYAL